MALTAKVLRLNIAQLDPQQPLNALGLDSMMASELKNRIDVCLNVNLAVVELLQGLSLAEIGLNLMPQLSCQHSDSELTAEENLSPDEVQRLISQADQATIEQILGEIEQLSEDKAQTFLIPEEEAK